MQEANFRSSPLTQSVIYKSFSHAIKEIGLPDLPEHVFTSEIAPRLKAVGNPFSENEQSLIKLWKSILRGQVIAAEVSSDEALMLYVRGGFGGVAVDVRLSCRDHQWHIESVISIFSRPIVHSPWFYRAACVTAVVAAAVFGYVVHQPSSGVDASATQHTVAPPVTEPIQTERTSQAPPAPKVSQPAPQTATFTLSHGTSLHDLSKFLHAHHLIDSSAVAFDMVIKKSGADRQIKPGVYTFRTGMSESQLIQVLKNGPTHS